MGCSILLLASAVSTLGGLVFGYELGIISGALLQLKAEFRLSCVQQEALVSALLIGALLASVVGGGLIDRHGRRNSILLSNVLILTGSLVLLCSSYPALVLGRITVGFAMCISSMSCCIFVSELVSPDRRGLLVTLYEAGITAGILAAYAMNYILSDTKGGWKCMFGLAVVPTLVQLASIWFLPSNTGESSSQREGAQTERDLMSPTEDQDADSNRADKQEQYNVMYLLQRKDNMRTRTIIGLGLVIFQQLTGQPNVLFYASTIFHSVGFRSNASAVLASVGLGLVKVIATLISMALADRVGRRPLLISGCSVMAVCLITIGFLSGHSALDTKRPCDSEDFANATSLPHVTLDSLLTLDESHRLLNKTQIGDVAFGKVRDEPLETASSSHLASSPVVHGTVVNWIILICMMFVVSAYSIGFGPMTWLVLSEIFPAGVRGRAFAFTNCFNWAANLLVTFSFLNVIDAIGLSGTFLLYGMTGVAAGVFFYFMLPETKGKSLEEIDKELCLKRIHHSEECCGVFSRRITSLQYQRVHCQLSTPG
ncbi:solute carrier family 2, facilitated glucose transporter member 10 [Centroberyx affinis]|uniref:solute carrier family 2, facilitated glucose transporter member 10 n=1 Tax=Centroberyx affinis TaxID=166261 RepID=UPI003A5C7315